MLKSAGRKRRRGSKKFNPSKWFRNNWGGKGWWRRRKERVQTIKSGQEKRKKEQGEEYGRQKVRPSRQD